LEGEGEREIKEEHAIEEWEKFQNRLLNLKKKPDWCERRHKNAEEGMKDLGGRGVDVRKRTALKL